MNPSSIRLPGAASVPTIGQSAPARPAAPASADGAPAGSGAAGPFVIDVTEETFEVEIVQRSMHTPVVMDFWAEWCGPCKQLGPVLERFANEDGGQWVLAKIDVDANQRLANAAQVQGIPAVKAVIKGQVIDLFTGAAAPAQVRQVLDQLMKIAAQQGMDPKPTADGEVPAPPALDPDLERGDEAFAAGDFDGAEAGYNALLSREPGNVEALSSLARVALVRRATSVDQQELLAAVDANPNDPSLVMQVSDLLVLNDRAEEAFTGLINCVRQTEGKERDAVRARLLDLFLILGDGDERVLAARRSLANALF